jgi:hypothetical protein
MLVGMFQDQLLQVIMLQARNAVMPATDLSELLPPMIQDNYEAKSVCWREDTLKAGIVTTQVSHPSALDLPIACGE